jgi:hypothetical protein
MKIATALSALFLTLAPGFALAEGCPHEKLEQAASCVPGTVWDDAKGTCVDKPTS